MVADVAKNMVGSTGFCGRFGGDHFLCLQERGREQGQAQLREQEQPWAREQQVRQPRSC